MIPHTMTTTTFEIEGYAVTRNLGGGTWNHCPLPLSPGKYWGKPANLDRRKYYAVYGAMRKGP